MGLDMHIYSKKEDNGQMILVELLYFGKYYQVYNYFIKHVCYNIELDNVLFPFEREDIDILVGLCSHILNNKEDFKMLPYHHSYNSYNTIGNVEYDGEYFYQLHRILEQISKSGYEDYDEFYFVWN